MDTMDRIRKILREVLHNPELIISSETCAADISAWDSLAHINIISMLEEEFDIMFEVDDIIEMESVGDIERIIKKMID